MSQRNLAAVLEFCDSTIVARRRDFYRHVRDRTQRWERAKRHRNASPARGKDLRWGVGGPPTSQPNWRALPSRFTLRRR